MVKTRVIEDTEIMDIVNQYVVKVCENYKVETIILFGSYAKGTNHQDSDIDIAIITDDFENSIFDEELNLTKLRRNIDLRIEPHLFRVEEFNNIETPLIQEIVDTGIRVA